MKNQDYHELVDLKEKACIDGELLYYKRLGGMTNRTYHVQIRDKNYLFRLPGIGTESLINRAHEKKSTELASQLGIDTALIYFDAVSGQKVSVYVDHPETLNANRMRETKIITKVADVLRTLHQSSVNTGVPFELPEMIQKYESIILSNGVAFLEAYDEVRRLVFDCLSAQEDIEKVSSHNDPLCENWVLSDEKLYLVDWEYAGMNDPMWDLADVSIEANYSMRHDAELLSKYFNHQPSEEETERFVVNKIYIDFLWSLWGLTRERYDGASMRRYAEERYSRMLKNLKHYQHVKA